MGTCILCLCPEPDGINADGSKRVYEPEGKFICSKCTRVIAMSTPKQLKKAYDYAIEHDMSEKAAFLENLLSEEDDDGEVSIETCKTGGRGSRGRKDGKGSVKRNLDRKRVVRKARFAGK